LFTLAFLSVSGYVRAVAMGALDLYGYLHHFIVFPCAPVVFTPPSYFVDHHPMIFLLIYWGDWKQSFLVEQKEALNEFL
jgi:hypothetical protein